MYRLLLGIAVLAGLTYVGLRDAGLPDVAAGPPTPQIDASPDAPRAERCFVSFRVDDKTPAGFSLGLWEYSSEDGQGRVVCFVDPSYAEGRVLETTESSYLVDTGSCTGWVSRLEMAKRSCE